MAKGGNVRLRLSRASGKRQGYNAGAAAIRRFIIGQQLTGGIKAVPHCNTQKIGAAKLSFGSLSLTSAFVW